MCLTTIAMMFELLPAMEQRIHHPSVTSKISQSFHCSEKKIILKVKHLLVEWAAFHDVCCMKIHAYNLRPCLLITYWLTTSLYYSVLMPEVTLTGATINFCQWCFKCLYRQNYQGKCVHIVRTTRAAPCLAVLLELWVTYPAATESFLTHSLECKVAAVFKRLKQSELLILMLSLSFSFNKRKWCSYLQ